ncbi:MAG: hypothetical protein EZS28_028227 [Streblomastix strix]|uniref:PPM-type phosphatase domain-containing protein n=1 Tax=Streblomastix strix TaxID=222440 RepID=A0A5J4UZU0_9EUKA|nr:MAG: hypothetical protein EZS28_028227 [Streblomastix strix]
MRVYNQLQVARAFGNFKVGKGIMYYGQNANVSSNDNAKLNTVPNVSSKHNINQSIQQQQHPQINQTNSSLNTSQQPSSSLNTQFTQSIPFNHPIFYNQTETDLNYWSENKAGFGPKGCVNFEPDVCCVKWSNQWEDEAEREKEINCVQNIDKEQSDKTNKELIKKSDNKKNKQENKDDKQSEYFQGAGGGTSLHHEIRDRYIVIACDGLFDVLETDNIGQIAFRDLMRFQNAQYQQYQQQYQSPGSNSSQRETQLLNQIKLRSMDRNTILGNATLISLNDQFVPLLDDQNQDQENNGQFSPFISLTPKNDRILYPYQQSLSNKKQRKRNVYKKKHDRNSQRQLLLQNEDSYNQPNIDNLIDTNQLSDHESDGSGTSSWVVDDRLDDTSDIEEKFVSVDLEKSQQNVQSPQLNSNDANEISNQKENEDNSSDRKIDDLSSVDNNLGFNSILDLNQKLKIEDQKLSQTLQKNQYRSMSVINTVDQNQLKQLPPSFTPIISSHNDNKSISEQQQAKIESEKSSLFKDVKTEARGSTTPKQQNIQKNVSFIHQNDPKVKINKQMNDSTLAQARQNKLQRRSSKEQKNDNDQYFANEENQQDVELWSSATFVASKLRNSALALGSTDNISVIVLRLL